ncbi:MAG: hypothetical protein IPG01_09650 [Chitinophagaceae bacterium]|nr:hypothetical protein [Chitinophagaceae bacterium]
MSQNELSNAGGQNINPEGDWVEKYITPDIYSSSSQAYTKLALPTAPEVAIYTFESTILATKLPRGPGIYSPVAPSPSRPTSGGGNEATIFQYFPTMGSFPLTK